MKLKNNILDKTNKSIEKNLKEYRKKRDFDKTPEPTESSKKDVNKPIFVIQKHDASRLHYDFRIEDEGVLKSWAVPKGIPTSTKERHLAIQTEDHPLSYANFSGTIPEGQYGAGTVEIWDSGTYKNLKDNSIANCIKDGEVSVWLEGNKLNGGYTLVRTSFNNDKKNWLIIKMKDGSEE